MRSSSLEGAIQPPGKHVPPSFFVGPSALAYTSRLQAHAREHLFDHLNALKLQYTHIDNPALLAHLPNTAKHIAKECIRVMKNILHTESEHISGTSALALLRHLARVRRGLLLRSIHALCAFHSSLEGSWLFGDVTAAIHISAFVARAKRQPWTFVCP